MTLPHETIIDGNQAKSFMEHLEDLRGTIIFSVLWLAVGMLVCIPFAPRIFSQLKQPLSRAGQNPETFLTIFSVSGGFGVAARIIFWSGLIVSLPFILLLIGRFVMPAMTALEKRMARRAAAAGFLLFFCGTALAYLMMPLVLGMMLRVNVWLGAPSVMWDAGLYVAFVLKMMLVFGLAFEFPVIVFLLVAAELLTVDQLRLWRRHAIVAISLVAMLVTPQDPYTMVLLAVPLVLLYEGCIICCERLQAGD